MASQINENGINDGIGWCHYTANLWHGCTKVHEGCDHCYAETLSKRWGNDIWGNDKPRKEIKSVWKDLLKYQKMAKDAGEIHRVFVGSMMDIFEKPMPLVNSKGIPAIDSNDGWPIENGFLRERFFEEVIPTSPNLMFLLLTKRPSNINKYIPDNWKNNPPENVMYGASAVNQRTLLDVLRHLDGVNGKHFISMEPQLDFVNLPNYIDVDWIIQGGESGHHRRPFNLDWAYSMKLQCKEAGIPYFFKQIDKVQAIPEDLMIREFPVIEQKIKQ